MRRTANAIVLAGIVAAVGTSCTTSAGSTTRACANFDRSYAQWQSAPANTTSQRVKANAHFVSALDHAVSAAGGTSLAEALQLLGATISHQSGALQDHQGHQRTSATKAIPIVVTAIRKTCPPA